MNRIASTPQPIHFPAQPFSTRTQGQPLSALPAQKPDQVLFGHKTHKKHDGHDHAHGAEGHHHTHDEHGHCTDTVCTKPHADETSQSKKMQGNWLERQIEAIKNWFTNAYEHIRYDLARLGYRLGLKKDDPSKGKPH